MECIHQLCCHSAASSESIVGPMPRTANGVIVFLFQPRWLVRLRYCYLHHANSRADDRCVPPPLTLLGFVANKPSHQATNLPTLGKHRVVDDPPLLPAAAQRRAAFRNSRRCWSGQGQSLAAFSTAPWCDAQDKTTEKQCASRFYVRPPPLAVSPILSLRPLFLCTFFFLRPFLPADRWQVRTSSQAGTWRPAPWCAAS